MKKWIKYIGITFAILIGIGIIGNLLGVEPAKKEIDTESKEELAKAEAEKKAEKEAEDAEEKALKEAKEKAESAEKAEEKAKEVAEKAEKVAKEEEKEAERKAEEAKEKAKEEKELAKQNAKEEAEEKAAAEQKNKEEANSSTEKEKKTVVAEIPVWQKEITTLAGNSHGVADKLYALEKFLISHKVTNAEVKDFSSYIVSDYKSGSYLSDIGNHERMLTNILKSYYVEKNAKGALKDFAFDYLQNMKYTYRGVDSVNSDSVKSNENQMNKALKEIK